MATNQQLSIEERKKNREKFMIKEKENETIYRHYGDLNGADFKLRKNKNCEIYILDYSKGMYIDDCIDCKIICGPIDGSIFIRGSKNCQISIIARQVRFRSCENLKVFTYCPSDPAVESSFNIYFAPFNAYFPHLKELFEKGGFKKDEKNHIDTPYDFTPSEELGGGAPHHLKLPEEEFFIKTVEDGKDPVEEMYEGYSQEEPWIKSKSSELPNLDQRGSNDNNNFNFIAQNEEKPVLNDFITSPNDQNEKKNIEDNLMNMDDFLSGNNNPSNQKNQKGFDFNNNTNNNDFNFGNNDNNNNNNNFMDMNDFLGGNENNNAPKMNNQDFNNVNMNNKNNFSDNLFNNSQTGKINSFNDFKPNIPNNFSNVDEEEIKRQELRNKEREMRQAKIREKMEKEAKLRTEIMAKASEYMTQFFEERQKRIAQNHERLLKDNGNQNKGGENPWQMVESSFNSSSSADRMKEAILNRNKDQSK